MKKVILIGSGGHAKVLLDILNLTSVSVIGYLDLKPNDYMDIPYLGADEAVKKYSPQDVNLVNGVGSVRLPELRQEIYERFKKMGYYFFSVIHPRSIIASNVKMAEGVQVIAGAVINPGVQISHNAIINTSSSVDHDSFIGAHSHIAPGVTLSGDVTVGETCHIGTGVKIIQGIKIGNRVLIGAGEVIRQDIASGDVVVGARHKI